MACVKFPLLLLLCSLTAKAQTFSEWFRQKSTQKEYLYQQIAALQVYSGYLQKGYRLAQGGLGHIGGYLLNEYGLHDAYNRRLWKVSPTVRNDPQVKAILQWQQDILRQVRHIQNQEGLGKEERRYTEQVCRALLGDCKTRLNVLQTLLTDQYTRMPDKERLRHLAKLHDAMQDNYCFAAGFQSDLRAYVFHKKQETRNVKRLKQLYENQ